MAPVSAGTAFIDVVPNTAGFSTALSSGITKQSSGIAGQVKTLGRTLGITLGAGLAVGFAKSSFDAFAESEQVVSQLNAAIGRTPELVGETTSAFEEQATALQNLTGFQDEEILKADTVLTRFQLTGDQIRDLIPLILDYARATNTDATSAALGIGRALLGNTRALKTLGIEFTATGDRSRDLATLMDALKEKVGGAAEEFGNTLAGKIEIAKAKLDDFKESIGEFLGAGLLLLTGNVRDAASMFVELGDASAGAVAHFGDIAAAMGAANEALAGVALIQIQPTLDWIDALAAEQGAAEQAAQAADALAAAHAKLNVQLRETWDLENQAAGGLVGLAEADAQAAEAQRGLAAAQAKVNTLTANGKKGTEEYRQAVRDRNAAELDSIRSQQSLEGAAQSLYAEFRKGNVSLAEAESRLRAQAAAAGLSRSETERLIDKVDALYAADARIPGDVRTTFTAPGLEDEMAKLVAYWTRLNTIPTHIDTYVTVHYEQTGNPTTKGPAT